ncbi:MAG: tetratricopeptide repeat protein [Gammaproteobacteria bacterium]|nr:tetratricopeptide repeat protein [Gammaproteobacteria bacterium]
MDALKKAEQEKKEAAKRLEESREAPEPGSGDAVQVNAEITAERPIEAGQPDAVDAADAARHSATQRLSLEPMAAHAAPAAEAGDPSLKLSVEPSDEGGREEPSLEESRATPRQPAPGSGDAEGEGDRTFHGAEPDVVLAGLFEPTVQGEPIEIPEASKSYDETLPGVPAVQLARDIGGDGQPTPVAAQTVFTAGGTKAQPSPGLKWTLISLAVLAVLAAGIWYYYTVTPVSRDVPSPLVARGIETLAPPPTLPVESADQTESGALIAAETGTGAEAGARAESPLTAPAPATGAEDASLATTLPAAGPRPEQTPEPQPAAAATDAAEPAPAIARAQPDAAAALPAVIEPPPSLIKISRRRSPSNEGVTIQRAYAAYQAGDLAGAKAYYSAVLDRFPDNTDALLGLGAVAVRENDAPRALEFYARVLRTDPRNKTATAVLIGLHREADLVASESALKSMIHDSPEHPFLYFTLGNVYAAQQRWPESQQAFFDAYRYDSSNPDYAFNLAVSLDRLGQRESAQDYYATALKLSDDRAASFDPAVALARVRALSPEGRP